MKITKTSNSFSLENLTKEEFVSITGAIYAFARKKSSDIIRECVNSLEDYFANNLQLHTELMILLGHSDFEINKANELIGRNGSTSIEPF